MEQPSDVDFRVHVKSKKIVRDQLERYKDLLRKLLDDQSHISVEDKEKLLQDMIVNFEFTLQENLVIGGLSWDEASDDFCEDPDTMINDMLDDKIVETACKRGSYPKQICNQVVRTLKAERKLMGLYEQAVTPKDIKPDPAQETLIQNVSNDAPAVFKQASAVMKSLHGLKAAAEGLREVLVMSSSAEPLEVYREVSRSSETCPNLHKRLPSTIKRAISDSEYSADYVPAQKLLHKIDANAI